MGKVRKHFLFSGRVQGVGFRYRAYHIARMLDLGGFVRNCDDDRVEMELEGEEESIQKMLELLDRQSFIMIDGIEMRRMPVMGERDFEIL